jgi:hypothetical protein
MVKPSSYDVIMLGAPQEKHFLMGCFVEGFSVTRLEKNVRKPSTIGSRGFYRGFSGISLQLKKIGNRRF